MNVRQGLGVALVAAVVSAVITGGGLLLFKAEFSPPIEVANGKMASQSQIEDVIADYLDRHHTGIDLSNPADKARMTKAVHDYLVQNPEVLVDMSNELDKRQKAQQAAQQKKAIAQNADKIFRSPNAFVADNPKGNVSVVEFFDYNCGFCKRALPDVVKLTQTDHNVRLVLKELPIFGKDSEEASRVALAVMKLDPSKYFELHQRLFADPGPANEAKALNIAQSLGVNTDEIKKTMNDPWITAALKENAQLAADLDLQGTPLYLVGDQVIDGAPTDLYDQLETRVKEVRKHGCSSTC
jgi:protein-disulfide isomerase